jgi:hypothetical protein
VVSTAEAGTTFTVHLPRHGGAYRQSLSLPSLAQDPPAPRDRSDRPA